MKRLLIFITIFCSATVEIYSAPGEKVYEASNIKPQMPYEINLSDYPDQINFIDGQNIYTGKLWFSRNINNG